jgi:hypothetical protein
MSQQTNIHTFVAKRLYEAANIKDVNEVKHIIQSIENIHEVFNALDNNELRTVYVSLRPFGDDKTSWWRNIEDEERNEYYDKIIELCNKILYVTHTYVNVNRNDVYVQNERDEYRYDPATGFINIYFFDGKDNTIDLKYFNSLRTYDKRLFMISIHVNGYTDGYTSDEDYCINKIDYSYHSISYDDGKNYYFNDCYPVTDTIKSIFTWFRDHGTKILTPCLKDTVSRNHANRIVMSVIDNANHKFKGLNIENIKYVPSSDSEDDDEDDENDEDDISEENENNE